LSSPDKYQCIFMGLFKMENKLKNVVSNSRSLNKLVGTMISESDAKLLDQFEFDKNDEYWFKKLIKKYIKNGYPLDVLIYNYDKIRALGRDSSSLASNIIRYGEEIGTRIFNEKNLACSITAERLANKVGAEEAVRILRSRAASIEIYIENHGEELGRIKWQQYLDKRAATYRKKHEDGHIFPKYNLDYYITLYGEEKGKEVHVKKINSQRYKVSKQYYIDQYGEVEGLAKLRKCKDNCSIEYYIEKFGEELGSEKYANRCKRTTETTRNSYSGVSKIMFDAIKETITDLYYYAENEITWALSEGDGINQRAMRPDLFYNGKVIEFNGDAFHANPLLYEESDSPHPFKKELTSLDIWELDEQRYRYYRKNGFPYLVIWEKEFRENMEGTIEKCIQFLTS
jgi:hypothetical protein